MYGAEDGPHEGTGRYLGTDFLKWCGHMLTSLKRFHLFCVHGLQLPLTIQGRESGPSPGIFAETKAQGGFACTELQPSDCRGLLIIKARKVRVNSF